MKTISPDLLATATGGQMLRNYSQRNAALTSQLSTLQDSIKSVVTAQTTAQAQQQSQQTTMMMMAMMMRR